MDILISVFAKVAEYLVPPAKRCACLMFDFQPIVGKLRADYEQLQCIYNQLNSDCEEAVRRDGEKIDESVNQWSKEAKATLAEVQNWLDSAKAESTICRHCPHNWGRNYGHSREAKRKSAQIHQLLTCRQTFSTLTRPASPKGIEILQQEKLPKLSSFDRTLKKIMEALEKSETNMVGVCGMGGIGKTTLVKEVGFKVKTKGLFNMVVMAVVSQSAEIHRIQKQLGEQLNLRYNCETEYGRANQLRARIKLEGKILVILDDVWSKIKLTEIGIPHGDDHDGCCKVLLSTRREQVCTSTECQEIIRMEILEYKEAWDLFKRNVGPILDDMSPEMEKVAKGVCRECDGLPLALVVVGRALRDKNLTEWQCAAEKLQRSRLGDIEAVDHQENVYERIKLSYDFLKGDVTKKCFLLCSLFPEDHEIEMGELALYATGFGLFDEYESAIHQVESTINDLIESSLLMRDNSRSRNVRMHDMVRDAALWMTADGEDKFLVPIPLQRNWTRNQKFDNVGAISLLACPDNQHFPHEVACPRLKILALAQRVPLHLRDNCFQGMQTLSVLDLTARRPLELVLPTSLQHLDSLRTLLLRRWKLSGDISIIGSLSILEILSLSGCAIAELPMALVKLSELRFLDLSGCKGLSKSYTEVVAQLMKQELRVIHGPNVQMKALEDNE